MTIGLYGMLIGVALITAYFIAATTRFQYTPRWWACGGAAIILALCPLWI